MIRTLLSTNGTTSATRMSLDFSNPKVDISISFTSKNNYTD
jgi:hypothetical protein